MLLGVGSARAHHCVPPRKFARYRRCRVGRERRAILNSCHPRIG